MCPAHFSHRVTGLRSRDGWPGSGRSTVGRKACAPALHVGKLRPREGELFVTMGRGGTEPGTRRMGPRRVGPRRMALGCFSTPLRAHSCRAACSKAIAWPVARVGAPLTVGWGSCTSPSPFLWVSTYCGGDEAGSSEDACRPRGHCPRSHFVEEGAQARPRVRSPSRAQPLPPGPQNHDLPPPSPSAWAASS